MVVFLPASTEVLAAALEAAPAEAAAEEAPEEPEQPIRPEEIRIAARDALMIDLVTLVFFIYNTPKTIWSVFHIENTFCLLC